MTVTIKERKEAKQKELEGVMKKLQDTQQWQSQLQTTAVEIQGQLKLLDEMEKPETPKEKK